MLLGKLDIQYAGKWSVGFGMLVFCHIAGHFLALCKVMSWTVAGM